MTGVQTCALRSEEHTSELQSHDNLVCRLLLEKTKHRSSVSVGTLSAPRSTPHPAGTAGPLGSGEAEPHCVGTGPPRPSRLWFFFLKDRPPRGPPLLPPPAAFPA